MAPLISQAIRTQRTYAVLTSTGTPSLLSIPYFLVLAQVSWQRKQVFFYKIVVHLLTLIQIMLIVLKAGNALCTQLSPAW